MIKNFISQHKSDMIAALSVACVAIPQSVAYSVLAGLPPQLGLYAASVPTILAAIFSTSRLLSTGPVAAISLLTAAALSEMTSGGGTNIIIAVVLLSLFVGAIQFFFGYFKLGSVINFVAHPVMVGFTSAAAIIICVAQVPKLLGIPVASNTGFFVTIVNIIKNSDAMSITTSIVGVFSLALLLLLKKFFPKIPGALVVIIISTLGGVLFGYSGEIVGPLPQGFLKLDITGFQSLRFSSILYHSSVIALVGFVTAISVIKSFATTTRDKINPNKELIAQGFANLSSGLVGSFPISGSLSRTALNIAFGAQSRYSSIFLGVIGICSILFFGKFLYHLAYATLAAIIIVAVFDMINLKGLLEIYKVRRRDGIVAAATLLSTLVFSPQITVGIVIGIASSIAAHLHRSSHPHLEVFFCNDKDYLHSHHYHLHTYPSNKKVLGVAVRSSLNFTNAAYIKERILLEVGSREEKPAYIMLITNAINHIDLSAEEVLYELHQELKEKKIQLLLAGVIPEVEESLEKTKLYRFIGGKNIYPEIDIALHAISEREKGK